MFNQVISFIQDQFDSKEFIPLHEPRFTGNEKQYLNECIDSTFVSYLGKFVTSFEDQIKEYTGAKHALAIVNGTMALHIAMVADGIVENDEVITQALTFVATANSISYQKAKCVFIDVDKDTMGMSPIALKAFLDKNASVENGFCINNTTGRRIKACMPMHTFGHPCRIDEIVAICKEYNISVIEDSAESLGSFYKGKHTGTFGELGVFSFNGNKTITCGGGGVVITDSDEVAARLKHLSTTAKVPHQWNYVHDEIGYNYRLPNVNASLAVAQMESLEKYLINKRDLAGQYLQFFKETSFNFITEPENAKSNYWLNAIILEDREQRDAFLEATNSAGVMTRPIWELMNRLVMYKDCQTDSLINSMWLVDRVVNIPSSVRANAEV
jgi:perosamine synthetase